MQQPNKNLKFYGIKSHILKDSKDNTWNNHIIFLDQFLDQFLFQFALMINTEILLNIAISWVYEYFFFFC